MSITKQDLAFEFQKLGFAIFPKDIFLKSPVRNFGKFSVKVDNIPFQFEVVALKKFSLN
jgi:ribosomal protein L9